MFLCPIVINLAGPHRLERALHSERADIDVTEDQGDEQHRDDGVHHLRDLHSGDVRDVEREQQQIAGYGNQDARAERTPEHQLFASVEPARRSMPRLDESTALSEPLNVGLIRGVVLDEDRDDQDETDEECEAREIVHILGGLRECAEGVVADRWQQQVLSEGDVQPGNPENDERHRGKPMREPLDCLEARHLASRSPRRDANPSEDEIAAASAASVPRITTAPIQYSVTSWK